MYCTLDQDAFNTSLCVSVGEQERDVEQLMGILTALFQFIKAVSKSHFHHFFIY